MRALIVAMVGLATAVQAAKLPPPNKLSLVQAQCGRCSCTADVDCAAGAPCVGGMCVPEGDFVSPADVGRVSCLADGDCAVGRSCLPVPHRCSPNFVVGGGTATLKSAREPAPTCPKRGDPTENKSGDVRLTGVTRDGAPFTGPLTAEVLLKTSFGADPNGTCALANTQIPFIGVLGSVDCRAGKCRGTLYAAACLPPECADTPITSELVRLLVRDGGGAPLAFPGISLLPAAGDAR